MPQRQRKNGDLILGFSIEVEGTAAGALGRTFK
jgi:hypothetical protein